MQLNGNHNCFVCECNFNWIAHIKTGGTGGYFIENEVDSQAIAVGNILSESGNVDYEITAVCPRCHNKNKFKHIGRKVQL